MSADAAERMRKMVDAVYRAESRRVLATAIRLLGDFDLAEEALYDAFRAALEQRRRHGVPANPRAWLASAGRFKASAPPPPMMPRRGTASASRTTGCGSSSPAATRPCRREPGPLKDIGNWVDEYRRCWEQSVNRLDEYLRELQSKEEKHGR